MTDAPHRHTLDILCARLRTGRLERREFLRTATLLGLSAGTAYLSAGLVDPWARASAADKPRGGTLRISNAVYDVSSPPTATTTAHPVIYSQVVEYLTVIDQNNAVRPHLLAGWEPSEDLRHWTLHLREGVQWHSGRPFVAEDVAWNLRRLLSDEVGSSVLGLMKGYLLEEVETGEVDDNDKPVIVHELWSPEAIEVVDDRTLRLNLKAPQLAVPEHLGHYPAVMLDPDDNGVFGPGANGTGAFTLVEIEPSRRAVLAARDDYWGEGPFVERVEFIDLGGSEQAVVNALVSKQVHGAFQVLPDFFPVLENQAHLAYYDVTTADTAVMRMNVNHAPFDDPRVRRALRLAVDAAQVNAVTFGPFGTPAEHHHVAPIHPEYAELPPMTRDVEAARALLAEAGFADGIDAELTIQQNPPHHLRNAEAMVAQWAEAGIRVRIKVVPNPQYWDIWTSVPMGVTVWAHRPLGVMNLSLAYRSGVAWNESGFSNAGFDALLDKAEAIADPDERRVVMEDIQRLMQEEGPIVQTYWRKLFTFYDKRVVGFAMHPTYQIFCNELALGDESA